MAVYGYCTCVFTKKTQRTQNEWHLRMPEVQHNSLWSTLKGFFKSILPFDAVELNRNPFKKELDNLGGRVVKEHAVGDNWWSVTHNEKEMRFCLNGFVGFESGVFYCATNNSADTKCAPCKDMERWMPGSVVEIVKKRKKH